MTFFANVPPVVDPARREHLAGLADNWDSYHGKPPTEAALKVLDSIALVPTVRGGWEIEVHVGLEEASIEVDAEGRIDSVYWGRVPEVVKQQRREESST